MREKQEADNQEPENREPENREAKYRARAADFQARARAARRRYNQLALLRLAVFVGLLLGVIYLASLNAWLGLAAGLAGIAGFIQLIRRHQALQRLGERDDLLSRINAREAAYQLRPDPEPDPAWPLPDDGSAFVDPDHPYSTDLDLFGPHSFFAYANRCQSSIGARALARMLQGPAEAQALGERQAAVEELAPALDWRQRLEAIGVRTEDDPRHLAMLAEWLDDPAWVSGRAGLQAAMWANPLLVLTGLVLVFGGWLPWAAGILFLLPAALVLRRTKERVDLTHRRTGRVGEALEQYGRLMRHVEGSDWTSPRLRALREALRQGEQPASRAVRRLAYLIAQLNVRYNFFAIFLNLFALWDLHWVLGLERWRRRHRGDLLAWFDALAEGEALTSLATLRYNHPEWVFPVIGEEARLEAEGLGHPLLPRGRRVTNDLRMPTEGHLKLITGSNMAGKSTLLRTFGLNIVLAMTGAPVCARALRLPRLQVFTSMRTQDALHESTSSFYAELKRLRLIIEAVEEPPAGALPVFFLLDEILKGTNSTDRHTGSRALLLQFIGSRAAGLVATHDLELGGLAKQYPEAIENLCMEVAIQDGELVFDYQLKPGVSQSFNATLLMRRMGIRVPDVAASGPEPHPRAGNAPGADKDQKGQ